MKSSILLSLYAAALATAIATPRDHQVVLQDAADQEQYLIELSPGETRYITEDEKWVLRRVHPLSSSQAYPPLT